jgi:hypothetical protein
LFLELFGWTIPSKPYRQVHPNHKGITRRLSSNQLFLEIHDSPPREHLLKEKSEIPQSFHAAGTNAINATEDAIRGMFRRRLCLENFREIAVNMSRRLSVASPGEAAKRVELIALSLKVHCGRWQREKSASKPFL